MCCRCVWMMMVVVMMMLLLMMMFDAVHPSVHFGGD